MAVDEANVSLLRPASLPIGSGNLRDCPGRIADCAAICDVNDNNPAKVRAIIEIIRFITKYLSQSISGYFCAHRRSALKISGKEDVMHFSIARSRLFEAGRNMNFLTGGGYRGKHAFWLCRNAYFATWYYLLRRVGQLRLMGERKLHQRVAAVEVQFLADVIAVGFDRTGADEERFGDL